MEHSSSIVPLAGSKGKEIVTQQENISLASLKATDTDKAICVKAYQKWTLTNKQGRTALFCCMLIDNQVYTIFLLSKQRHPYLDSPYNS